MSKGSLLIAGLAAFVFYKYSRLSHAEKENLATSIKETAKSFYNMLFPGVTGMQFQNEQKVFPSDVYDGGEFVG